MWGLCDNVVMRGMGVMAGGGREWCSVVTCGGGGRRDDVQRFFGTRENCGD
jgi:hypothetical protein